MERFEHATFARQGKMKALAPRDAVDQSANRFGCTIPSLALRGLLWLKPIHWGPIIGTSRNRSRSLHGMHIAPTKRLWLKSVSGVVGPFHRRQDRQTENLLT